MLDISLNGNGTVSTVINNNSEIVIFDNLEIANKYFRENYKISIYLYMDIVAKIDLINTQKTIFDICFFIDENSYLIFNYKTNYKHMDIKRDEAKQLKSNALYLLNSKIDYIK